MTRFDPYNGIHTYDGETLPHAARTYPDGALQTQLVKLLVTQRVHLVRIALRYVSSVELAEEVVQETWVAALTALPRYEGRASLQTWLFAILLNQARRARRLEQRWLRLYTLDAEPDDRQLSQELASIALRSETSPEAGFLRAELWQVIQAALLRLPARQREIYVLRELEGRSAEETSALLGVTESNQRVLLHRARQRVRHLVRRYLNGQKIDE
jgi:RNA polymerase sigma-70 factor, ECF subfamily